MSAVSCASARRSSSGRLAGRAHLDELAREQDEHDAQVANDRKQQPTQAFGAAGVAARGIERPDAPGRLLAFDEIAHFGRERGELGIVEPASRIRSAHAARSRRSPRGRRRVRGSDRASRGAAGTRRSQSAPSARRARIRERARARERVRGAGDWPAASQCSSVSHGSEGRFTDDEPTARDAPRCGARGTSLRPTGRRGTRRPSSGEPRFTAAVHPGEARSRSAGSRRRRRRL